MDNNHNDTVPEMETVSVNHGKKNKLAEAEALIEASQEIVAKVDSDIAECELGVSEAAGTFDYVKKNFKNVTLKKSDNLLEKVGFDYVTFEEAEGFELSVDTSSNQDFSVETLSSGRFTGLVLAILVALITVGAWIYLAMVKLGIDPSSVTLGNATSHVNPILNWIGADIVSGNANMILGASVLGFSALIMAWLVYALRTSMKGTKNLRIAKEMYAKSNEYCMTQEECQREMIKVDMHLREVIVEISNFEMILDEQASVLKRIIHVEGTYENDKEYHPSSKKVMRETEKIMRGAENLYETAITQERKLNFQSVTALNSAREIYKEYLSRIYI